MSARLNPRACARVRKPRRSSSGSRQIRRPPGLRAGGGTRGQSVLVAQRIGRDPERLRRASDALVHDMTSPAAKRLAPLWRGSGHVCPMTERENGFDVHAVTLFEGIPSSGSRALY